MPLYLYGNENNPVLELDEELNVFVTVESLNYNTNDTSFRTHDTFGYVEVGRINLKNTLPPSIKNTKVVWIMRGKRQSDNALITWRNPDTPSASQAGTEIVEGTIKVLGYFYED